MIHEDSLNDDVFTRKARALDLFSVDAHWESTFVLAPPALVDAVSSSGGDDDYQGPTDRWVVVDGENIHTWTGEGSADSPSWQALIEHFEVLASVHVWGQSPEDEARELDTPRVVSLTVGGSA